jgi:hypothetical protein
MKRVPMTVVKRYRRKATKKALQPPGPLFVLDPHEVEVVMIGGRP